MMSAHVNAVSRTFSRNCCQRQRFINREVQRRRKNSSSKVRASDILARRNAQEPEYLYGLKPVDFSIAPPIYRSPPPPPPRPGLQKYIFPISTLSTLAITAYFYFNNKNDSYVYWETMQTGGVLPGTDDDDEDYDEDFDDEED